VTMLMVMMRRCWWWWCDDADGVMAMMPRRRWCCFVTGRSLAKIQSSISFTSSFFFIDRIGLSMFRPLATNKCSICPYQSEGCCKIRCYVVVFYLLLSECCWWLTCYVFICFPGHESTPWDSWLALGWSLIAVKSGPTPLFIAKH